MQKYKKNGCGQLMPPWFHEQANYMLSTTTTGEQFKVQRIDVIAPCRTSGVYTQKFTKNQKMFHMQIYVL